jgi:hypothetical protein
MSGLELKEKIQKRLIEIEDEALLNEIYQMVCEDDAVYKLSDEQKLRVEEGRQQIKEGKVISNEEANRQAKEWLKK